MEVEVIQERIEGLGMLIKEQFKNNDECHDVLAKELSDIKIQTTKTNGSVRELQIWKARILGAMAVLAFLFSTCVALFAIMAKFLFN